MSPMPIKPCPGQFPAEIQQSIADGRNRSWAEDHACDRCGQMVTPRLLKGKWVPANHWASVTYSVKRNRVPGRYSRYVNG